LYLHKKEYSVKIFYSGDIILIINQLCLVLKRRKVNPGSPLKKLTFSTPQSACYA